MAARKKKVGHHLRHWRKHRGLSLEQVAERVALMSQERVDADPDLRPLTMTHATLSRIERGKLPYNQQLMEILADIYQTDVPGLVNRDPTDPEGIFSIWDTLTPPQRVQVVEIAKTIKRTGTEG